MVTWSNQKPWITDHCPIFGLKHRFPAVLNCQMAFRLFKLLSSKKFRAQIWMSNLNHQPLQTKDMGVALNRLCISDRPFNASIGLISGDWYDRWALSLTIAPRTGIISAEGENAGLGLEQIEQKEYRQRKLQSEREANVHFAVKNAA